MINFLIQGEKNEGTRLERNGKFDILILKSVIINNIISRYKVT